MIKIFVLLYNGTYMETKYTYNKETDFDATQIDTNTLQIEINEHKDIDTDLHCITAIGDDYSFCFPRALTSDEKTCLEYIIRNYVYVEVLVSKSSDRSCIVDPNGDGDYISIAAAFTDGNVSVFAKDGTYNEVKDIIIPTNGRLHGATTGKVIINLTDCSIIADGSHGECCVGGTIVIETKTNTIVGTDTTFTDMDTSYYVQIGTDCYKVESIADDTHLTIVEIYYGITKTNVAFKAMPAIQSIDISNLCITGSSTYGIFMRAIKSAGIHSVTVNNCNVGLFIRDVSHMYISDIDIRSCETGMKFFNCCNLSLKSVSVVNNTLHGSELEQVRCTEIDSCEFQSNGGDGMRLIGCESLVISECKFKWNSGNGLNTTEDISNPENDTFRINCISSVFGGNKLSGIICSDGNNIVSKCYINCNRVYGIHLRGTTCVEACTFSGNVSGIYTDEKSTGIQFIGNRITNENIMTVRGDNIIMSSNIIVGTADFKCIVVETNNSVIIGNIIKGYVGGDGIFVTGNGNIFSRNRIVDCLTAARIIGLDNDVDGNKTTGCDNGIVTE